MTLQVRGLHFVPCDPEVDLGGDFLLEKARLNVMYGPPHRDHRGPDRTRLVEICILFLTSLVH